MYSSSVSSANSNPTESSHRSSSFCPSMSEVGSVDDKREKCTILVPKQYQSTQPAVRMDARKPRAKRMKYADNSKIAMGRGTSTNSSPKSLGMVEADENA